MATAEQGGWFRKRADRKPQLRVLTAAATRIDLTDRVQARRERALRQGWQSDAWGYRDSIGELRYAIQFLANCTARMRFYPAAYATGGESDNPQPIIDLSEAPPNLAALCDQAMSQLGHGKLAISHIASALSTNTTVAGEAWMLGREDPQTGEEEWSIRSVDEIIIRDDRWQMREIPTDPQGVVPWVDLPAESTVLTRIWTPHPRFRLMADSPMRAMLDDCESLMIMRRIIRATGRSRLAGRGLLAIPEELSIKSSTDDDDDPDADPFLRDLTTAMTEPIADEGVASAVVPIVVRGPGEAIKQIQHIDFASKFDDAASKTREELIGIIATSMDLPKEVIMGVADLNHWSAWQVDDSTFRHHVEPHVITICDGLTGAYLRPYLRANGIPEEWVRRALIWYDPTELVTHPDQTADAKDLYDRHALSAAALARVAGFSEEDMPEPEETLLRMFSNMRTPPANLIMAAVHKAMPDLTIPPIDKSGTVPGVNPSGVDSGGEGAQAALPAGQSPVFDTTETPPPPTTPPPDQPTAGPPQVPGVTASGADDELDAVGVLDAIFALSDGTYGDMWVNDAKKRALLSFGDWEGDLVQPARAAAAGVLDGYDIEADAEVGAPSGPGWQQVYANGKRVAELPAITASGQPGRQRNDRLSRKLSELDRDLRTRIQTAANAAMLRQLERAGARLVSKVAKDETLRSKIAHRPKERAAAIIGEPTLTAAGISIDQLLSGDWSGLKAQFMQWVKATQQRALQSALKLAGIPDGADAATRAQERMDRDRESAWQVMVQALDSLAEHLLYNPDPNTPAGEWGDHNPDTLVPAGLVRAALAVAGGAGTDAVSVGADGSTSQTGFVGQIGTGETVSGLLTEAGGEKDQWEWNHASTVIDPFEGHLKLDGVEFASFDSDALANHGDWPPNAYYFPGDHKGCTCDVLPLWSFPGSPINDSVNDSTAEGGE